MMKEINQSFTCDVCGGKITSPHFRIEWGYNGLSQNQRPRSFDFIHVCHHNCSFGIQNDKNSPITFGDIIFDQNLYSDEDLYNRLDELSQSNPSLSEEIVRIKNKIFE